MAQLNNLVFFLFLLGCHSGYDNSKCEFSMRKMYDSKRDQNIYFELCIPEDTISTTNLQRLDKYILTYSIDSFKSSFSKPYTLRVLKRSSATLKLRRDDITDTNNPNSMEHFLFAIYSFKMINGTKSLERILTNNKYNFSNPSKIRLP